MHWEFLLGIRFSCKRSHIRNKWLWNRQFRISNTVIFKEIGEESCNPNIFYFKRSRPKDVADLLVQLNTPGQQQFCIVSGLSPHHCSRTRYIDFKFKIEVKKVFKPELNIIFSIGWTESWYNFEITIME